MLPNCIFIMIILNFHFLFSQTDTLNKEVQLQEVIIEDRKAFSRDIQQTEILHVLDNMKIQQVTACNIAEGLNFQSGLRVETNCQTCNYTQIRMNGLQGSYTQMLINGIPIMSSLMSLYGLEQFSSRWIQRIEIQKGAGSSLLGHSAIGGTVNIITQMPHQSFTDIQCLYQNIDFQSSDYQISAHSGYVSSNQKIGVGLILNHRKRQFYDTNLDGFSELPLIQSTNLGTSFFFKPNVKHELKAQFFYFDEYRLGGEMLKIPAYLLQQVEERKHHIYSGDLQYLFRIQENKELKFFTGFQYIDKNSITGIFPEDSSSQIHYLQNPPYGFAQNTTYQNGLIFKQIWDNILSGENILQIGGEFRGEWIDDKNPSYNYNIFQTTLLYGGFIQNEWKKNTIKIKKGLRLDKHSAISKIQVNPRVAILYQPHFYWQFRLQYGSGFRPPVFLDTDMHMAFASGGVSRIFLSPNILPETSHSYTASINFDKPTENYIFGFTIDFFYTRLKNIFVLENIGNDTFGEIFEKRNSNAANVQGITLEFRANYNKKFQFETGFTYQNQQYDQAIFYFDDLEGQKIFLRTPNLYGFGMLNYEAKNWSLNLNYNYTGKMLLPHFGGAENFLEDAYIKTQDFHVLGFKINCKIQKSIQSFVGIKNIFNAYQKDFDIGKNRDSNYIYGPNLPRTVFIGINFQW